MAPVRSYRDLIVWQRAMDLAKLVYGVTASFPASERYGLTSQLRRAAVSIAANIAEGHGRNSSKEFVQFLGISRGSLTETETLLILARDLNFIGQEDGTKLLAICEEISRLQFGLMTALNRRKA
jgi:four helix bundle protein